MESLDCCQPLRPLSELFISWVLMNVRISCFDSVYKYERDALLFFKLLLGKSFFLLPCSEMWHVLLET